MAYTRATLQEFQAIFTEFGTLTQPQYDYWAARAERIATDRYGDDQGHVAMLAAAHYMTLQGLGSGAESMRASKFGGATEVKSGTLSLGWRDGSEHSNSWTSTSYGKQLMPFIRLYAGGPLITGTGTLPLDTYGPA